MKSDKSKNNLLLKYMDFSINSSQNQSEYMNVMVNVCSTMLNLLKHENLIIDLDYNPSEFWPKAKNKTVAFGLEDFVFPLTIISPEPLSSIVPSQEYLLKYTLFLNE